MRRNLEIVANVTVISMALVVGFVVLTDYVRSYHTSHSIAAGDRIANIPGVDWTQHPRTLVLALNTNCHYCQDSLPFYQKLAQAQGSGSEDLELVAAFPNDAKQVRKFTRDEPLPIKSVSSVAFDKWHVAGTPTLLLVDAQGRVERTWVGILTARQELELLAIVSGTNEKQ